MFGFGKAGGLGNVLGTIGATLQDINSGGETQSLARWQAGRAAQAQQEQKRAAQLALMQRLGLGGASAPGVPGGSTGGLPSLRDAAPDLLAAQAAGLDVGDYINLLDKAQRKVEVANGVAYDPTALTPGQRVGVNGSNINGTVVDMQDPNSIGMQIPDMEKGMIRVPGPNGLPMALPMQNFDQILANREGAIAGAKAQATSPYDFINAPTPTGAPRVMSKEQARGGVFTGQSPADAIRANATASGEAERFNALQTRAATAGSQLDALDNMETLLPDVIAGFGAEPRLQAARAMAALGDEESKKKVAATETFINQGRVLVASIIKTFGANPTEGERKFAERMSGADAELNPETLKEGIRLQRARINRDLRDAGKAQATKASAAPPRSAVEAELRRRGLIP